MQIKEYEAYTLKECLQQVRNDLGPDAVILETRKIRKGGMLGLGQRDAVCIVAATGISVKGDLEMPRAAPAEIGAAASAKAGAAASANGNGRTKSNGASSATLPAASSNTALREPSSRESDTRSANRAHDRSARSEAPSTPSNPVNPLKTAKNTTAGQSAAISAARSAYARTQPTPPREEESGRVGEREIRRRAESEDAALDYLNAPIPEIQLPQSLPTSLPQNSVQNPIQNPVQRSGQNSAQTAVQNPVEDRRLTLLEQAMREIREGLSALHRGQQENQERTVSAVVSAVTPVINAAGNVAHLTSLAEAAVPRFPDLYARLTGRGVASGLAHELLDALPDFSAWSEEAQAPLAASALRDLIGRRVSSSGPIDLTAGTLKAIALIGPTGVGKTTTIAKLAAHYALVEKKRVGLLTMDTYRIAAVEQLKVYSQILDVPLSVAYSQAEAGAVIAQYADFDLLLIDTAGRSQKNIMQVGELKSMLELVGCETHLVLSAQTKEQDMVETAQRFSAARVDRLIFSKLDETDSIGTLLNVADRTGIPLSYLTTGQRVPEDLEIATGSKLADMLLGE